MNWAEAILAAMRVASNYTVACSCGRDTPVTKTDAGSEVRCACGSMVRVPRLSQLRREAGETAFAYNAVEAIQHALAEGTLPSGALCAYSQRPTSDVLLFFVECETPYRKGDNWLLWAFSGLLRFTLLLLAHVWVAGDDPPEPHGRHLVVSVPLLVDCEVQRSVRRLSQARLKELLTAVPLYARLFEDYPNARIYVG